MKRCVRSFVCAALGAVSAAAQDGAATRPAAAPIVLLTSVGEASLRPVLDAFTAKTGRAVDVVRAPRRGAAGDALAAEARRTGADVWWSREILDTAALKEAGALATLEPPPSGAASIPARFHDADGSWFGIAGRARVIMYNSRLVAAPDVPRGFRDLLDPRRRGKVGAARPTGGTALFHFMALENVLGAAEAEAFWDALGAGGVVWIGGDALLAERIGAGDVLYGMTDTSDYRAVKAKGLPVDAVYPDQDGVGCLVVPSTLGALTASKDPVGGRLLIEFLLGGEVEALLAKGERGQIPLRPGVPRPDDVRLVGEFKAMDVPLSAAAARADAAALRWRARVGPKPLPGGLPRPTSVVRFDFDDMALGVPPSGMTVGQTGAGPLGVWTVSADPSSRGGGSVVIQTDRTELGSRFPLLFLDVPPVADVSVSALFKTTVGDVDRAAGLFVRALDADNYYCCRANSLEDNVRFYKVVDGARIEIAGRNKIPVMEETWHSLRLEAEGDRFKVWMAGELLFEARDAAFPGPGKVGLWLKGDSVTAFDDVVVGPPGRSRRRDFEADVPGVAPSGLVAEALAAGSEARWTVAAATRPDGPSRVVAALAAGGEGDGGAVRRGGAVLLDPDLVGRDGSVAARFKVLDEGPGMQLAGLVARYRGPDEHYYLRINPEERNVRLYRVTKDARKLVGETHHVNHDEKLWHTVRLTVLGPRLEVSIDGVLQFAVADEVPQAAGRFGVWAAPGGGTLYDDVEVAAFD